MKTVPMLPALGFLLWTGCSGARSDDTPDYRPPCTSNWDQAPCSDGWVDEYVCDPCGQAYTCGDPVGTGVPVWTPAAVPCDCVDEDGQLVESEGCDGSGGG